MRYDAADPARRRLREPARRSSPTSSTATRAASSTAHARRLPGNDQTGAALAGPDWEDGGLDDGGIPFWPVVSLGDTGNGFLSAIGMVQALYHRDRTGEGQFVDTSIINAQLLNASNAWSTADGSRHGDRPQLDAMQLGWHRVLPPLRDRRRLAVRRRGRPTSSAARSADGARRATPRHERDDRVRRAASAAFRCPRPPARVVRRARRAPACRARSRRPTSCSASSTTRR